MAENHDTRSASALPLAQRIEDAFAEISACIDSVQGALRHYQQPQDVHFHLALKACRDGTAAASEITRLQDDNRGLLTALRYFLEDERFQVAVGGNPNAIDRMLASVRAALAKAEGRT
jgi:hypothetical protein